MWRRVNKMIMGYYVNRKKMFLEGEGIGNREF